MVREHHAASPRCQGYGVLETTCACGATEIQVCVGCGESLLVWPKIYGGCEHLLALGSR
jgi:hypothetical protein